MKENAPRPEIPNRKNRIVQLSRQYAKNHLLFLAMKKENYHEGLNKIASPQTKP